LFCRNVNLDKIVFKKSKPNGSLFRYFLKGAVNIQLLKADTPKKSFRKVFTIYSVTKAGKKVVYDKSQKMERLVHW
jgi:hypothetical protein